MLKGIFKDMSIYGLSQMLSQVLSIILLPIYTAHLSPEDYGVLALIGIFVSGYSIFSNFGVNSAIFRFTGMAKTEEEKKHYLENAQLINFIFNGFFLVLGLLLSRQISTLLFESNQYSSIVRIGVFSGFVGSLSSIPIAYYRVIRQPINIAKASIINLSFSVVFTLILLVGLGWGVKGALIGSMCGGIAGMFFLYHKVSFPSLQNFSLSAFQKLLKYALPMLPHKTFGYALPIASQVILSRTFTLTELGLFNIAYKFCMPLIFVTKIFQKAYSPIRFEIMRNHGKESASKFSKINLTYIGAVFFAYTLITMFGPFLIKLLTNEKFHDSSLFLVSICLIPIAQAAYFIFGTGIEFSKSPIYLPLISFTGAATTVLLSLTIIPELGIHGAAISTVSGWLIMAVLVYFYSQQLLKINYSAKKIIFIILFAVIIQSILKVFNFTIIDEITLTSIFLLVAFLYRKDLFRLKNSLT